MGIRGLGRTFDTGIGICPCHEHPVTYVTVMTPGPANNVFTNSRPTSTMLTIGLSSCGHPTIAVSCSNNVKAKNFGVHRFADTGINCGPYVLVSASNNVSN